MVGSRRKAPHHSPTIARNKRSLRRVPSLARGRVRKCKSGTIEAGLVSFTLGLTNGSQSLVFEE